MIKDILKRVIPQEERTKLVRVVKKITSGKKSENYWVPHTDICLNSHDTFFGYYDINPFRGEQLLCNRLMDNGVMENIVREKDGAERVIGTTKAWCWQQGCRLRWFPETDNPTVCFNAIDNNRYFTQIIDLSTGIKRRINQPIYDINPQGKYGAGLDFVRLGYFRAGYGYTNLPFEQETDLSKEGIDLIDMVSGDSVRIVTYEDIAACMEKNIDFGEYYLNHLSFDPTGNNLMFFFIHKGKIHQASLFVYQIKEKKLIPLELENSVSHYCWINDRKLLVTAYDSSRTCRYYIYALDGKKDVFMPERMKVDGHPTWVNETCIITDTYPDSNGFQKLLKVNPVTKQVNVLAELYTTEKCIGEKRTDLHPRVDVASGKVCIDSNVKGKRKMVVLEVDLFE